MLTFTEKSGLLFLLNDQGVVIQAVTEPAVLYDQDGFIQLKIGQKENIENWFKKAISQYQANGFRDYESWVLVDLPKDAQLLNYLMDHIDGVKQWHDYQLNGGDQFWITE